MQSIFPLNSFTIFYKFDISKMPIVDKKLYIFTKKKKTMTSYIESLLPKNDFQFSIVRFIGEHESKNQSINETKNTSKISYSFNIPWYLTLEYRDRHQLTP